MPKRKSFRFIASIFIFLLLNVLISGRYGRGKDVDGVLYALQNFRLKNNPNSTIVLGSSLAKHVFKSVEDTSDGKSLFNLSYNLQLISDSLVLSRLVLPAKFEGTTLLMVGPRDFGDSDVPVIYRTQTFRHLVKAPAIPEFYDYAPSLDDKCKVWASAILPIYDLRGSFQTLIGKAVGRLVQPIENEDDVPPSTREQLWRRGLAEYKWRYSGISNRLPTQLAFCSGLFSSLKEKGSSVLVVDLPLAKGNRSLLPQGFYELFRKRLSETAKESNVDYLDLADLSVGDDDFVDGAHLTMAGGRKVFNAITQKLAERRSMVCNDASNF